MAQSSHQDDPFDALLTLEDSLYTTAYSQGVSDGAHAGRVEGRVFGLEKGFEKFAELGHLHGRSVIWGARLPSLDPSKSSEVHGNKIAELHGKGLPALRESERLRNNITLAHSLTDPETFDTANTEEGVADFDDRFKRAGAKTKVIERIVGETPTPTSQKSPDGSPTRAGKDGPMRITGLGKKAKKGEDSMEDFAGSRLVR